MAGHALFQSGLVRMCHGLPLLTWDSFPHDRQAEAAELLISFMGNHDDHDIRSGDFSRFKTQHLICVL